MPVALVTDTTAYAPRELIEDNDIHLVSLYVNQGGDATRESEITDYERFYDTLRTTPELPTTSQPSIGDFLEVFEPLAGAGNDIVSVHLAGGISGTVESARQAAQEVMSSYPQRRVEVIDSRKACGALAFAALAGTSAARAGGDVDAVAARVQETCDQVKLWFAVDTLEFLRRGGRIGAAQAWLGGALKIKPILTVEGEITPIERVRTAGRAFERMVEFLRSQHADGADGWMVQHIQAHEQAERLVEAGKEIFGHDPLMVSEIGPVIGCHVGPGLLGVGGGPAALGRRAAGRVLNPRPDHDFDVTEVAVPWRLLTDAGHEAVFATEQGGAAPAADQKLLDGVIFGQLGAYDEPKAFYREMIATPAFRAPIAWADVQPEDYDGLLLAGGHAPGMRQYLSSTVLAGKVAEFWALDRPVAAICHGVLVLARTRDPQTGRSVIAGRRTTCLPKYMERGAFWVTAWRLGRYYRTYPAYVEDEVKAALDDPGQFERGPRSQKRGSADDDSPTFLVEDGHYLSARWPGDAYAFGKRFVRMLEDDGR